MGLTTVSDIMDGLDSVQLDSEKLSVVLLLPTCWLPVMIKIKEKI